MFLEFRELTPDLNPHLETQLTVYHIIIPVFGAIIILINLLVVVSSGLIITKNQSPKCTYLFLGNVALTDTVTGIAVILGAVYPKEHRDHYLCAVQLGMIVSSTLASIYSVGLIALDRYLYILHGIVYQQLMYPFRARLLIVLVWIIGGIVGFLPLMGWYGDTDNGRVCWFIMLAPRELIVLTVIIGFIPIFIVVIINSFILRSALKTINRIQRCEQSTVTSTTSENLRISKNTSNLGNDDPQNSRRRSVVRRPTKFRAVKVILLTLGSFVITWCPYFIASLIYTYCEGNFQHNTCETLKVLIASPLGMLGFANSLINPMIYAWWHKGFREFVKQKLCCSKKVKFSKSHDGVGVGHAQKRF